MSGIVWIGCAAIVAAALYVESRFFARGPSQREAVVWSLGWVALAVIATLVAYALAGAYLHDLAARLEDGRLDLDRLRTLDYDAARTELTQVKGVGRFTADRVLMLALRRPDVWPAADLALRRAIERVWGLDAPASVAQVDALGERFRPWRTLAAAYLYRTRMA